MKAIWTGSIGFGLVNIPVKVYSAVQDSRLELDMLDAKTHSPIHYKRVSEKSGKEIPWEQIKKGFLLKEEYVILDDSDFEAASPKKTKIIEIEAFVDEHEIDSIYFENPYFLEPAKGGEKAYQLLLKALEKTKKVGLSRFVMRSQEHLSVIRPRENYLLLQQLRFEEELKSPSEIKVPSDVRIAPKELTMALELIKQYSASFDISQYEDEYKKELMKIIKRKATGKKIPQKKLEVVYTKKDDLIDQLKASLNKTSKKRAS
ncbi:MAG: Ku protein [Saprospiraceae bacterium]|uniref:Non-homologous end joining protein Ku n=1 Tax=Candidatus Opimibacter skivensis TaxID=2982028 RepID=A0A9D7XT02_9BACT|nr:Ku protein [Candidatus Opimibacter skivensis]